MHCLFIIDATPVPIFTIGHNYSPYSRIATDPVTFSCSFTYSSFEIVRSITWASVVFKSGNSSSIQSTDITVATATWNSNFSSSSSSFISQVAGAYSSRIIGPTKVSDIGTFKNLSITLGISNSLSSPNYYTLSDVGYYYCQLIDSTGGSTFSSTSHLSAYCMIHNNEDDWWDSVVLLMCCFRFTSLFAG